MKILLEKLDFVGLAGVRFPSPRPSPKGRGRIFRSLIEKLMAVFAEPALKNRGAFDSCSLSPRERVWVRGNARFFMLALKIFTV